MLRAGAWPSYKHWRKYGRKDKETGDRRNARKIGECRREGWIHPVVKGETPGSATQWRADALDFVASFLRLVRVLSSFL